MSDLKEGLGGGITLDNATELSGYRVKAGSLTMGDVGYSGLVHFSEPYFKDANYILVASAGNLTLPAQPNEGSGASFGVSGALRASGCWLFGPSGTTANWIAVGL